MPSSASTIRPPPISTLFPYTTLFQSSRAPVPPLFRSGCLSQSRIRILRVEHFSRSEEHTSELQSLRHLVCRLLLQQSGHHQYLHSSPTRRSSNLVAPLFRPCSGPVASARAEFVYFEWNIFPDRKSTRLNSSHFGISYAVFCFNNPATTNIYTLPLHDALPI